MNSRIEYRDTLGVIITKEQMNILSEYTKLIYDSNTNRLKIKLKCFEGDIAWDGEYYMDQSENLSILIPKLDQIHRWEIMSELEVINGYNLWKGNHYHNEELYEIYSKQVFNFNGDLIAKMWFDPSNQNAIEGIKKFYLGNKNIIDEDGGILEVFEQGDYVIFSFKSDGSFSASSSDNHIFWKPYLTLPHFLDNQQNGFVMNLMTEEMKKYYLNFHPLVPPFNYE